MLPSIFILALTLIISTFFQSHCFRLNTHLLNTHNYNHFNPSFNKFNINVYHDSTLAGLISSPEEFKLIPNYLRYENLTNFVPDRSHIIHNLKSNFLRFRRVTLRKFSKLRFISLSNFRRCYYDLLDEIKFWYLKGSNFSFYDLFAIGDNPVYILVKLNLFIFILDFFFKGNISNNYSVKGLNLFYMNEHYRILTSLFIHWDIRHLISNIGSLLSIGNNVLKVFGPRNLLLIYFISGITSNYFSYLYNYIYKNGIPANLLIILRYIGLNFTSATKPIITATNTIVDDILNKTKRVIFPLFMFDYLLTCFTMSFDSIFSLISHLFSGTSPRSLNDVDLKVREICISKSRNDFRSCGASSSIFGLYGALLTYYVRSGYIQNYSVINNLFVSFIVPYILRSFTDKLDHVSHLVGFITGSLLSTTLD